MSNLKREWESFAIKFIEDFLNGDVSDKQAPFYNECLSKALIRIKAKDVLLTFPTKEDVVKEFLVMQEESRFLEKIKTRITSANFGI